ncbi:DUF4249 domain-containing protein [Hymenobacter sp. BT507]|uniref:DUF4249 domain-containing protein n=1 Tax=Hymenobacter citatus TaxID=2763506 RepID=A0ABR7MFP9_9BACT|nr:DUF4249 domain-containing protein [Hymenobacter citatus]MBC6609902.1 DUF4249 domain-containing protein [Hymenobacter citatus]
MLLLASCVETFDPEVAARQTTLLVVDGFINSRGVTTIKLSRTANLQDTATTALPEKSATVQIEEELGRKVPLVETLPGTYTSPNLTLEIGRKYRICLRTATQKEYVSDYVAAITTPVIDHIYWRPTRDGAAIYVDSHDEPTNTRYYRWAFEETWEFTSAFRSLVEYNVEADTVVPRKDNIYNCWASSYSSSINLVNTNSLVENKIVRHTLTTVPSNSVKLRFKYSVLAKQYAQTKEEYDYWALLKKNTEDIGSIYGPLPVQLSGNVHAVESTEEAVIGFVGVYSQEEKRLFIDRSEIPADWEPAAGLADRCIGPDTLLPRDKYLFALPNVRPIGYIRNERNYFQILAYTYSSDICVDCRKTGANVKPSFWR